VADYLDHEELEALLRQLDRSRDRLLVRFLFESGCSISETASIASSSLSPDGVLTLPDRTVVISPSLAQDLLSQAGAFLFSSRQTQTITPKRIQQILKPHLKLVHTGKTTPHVLRYTHIVHAYKQGVPLQAISLQTGLSAARVAQIVADVPSTKAYTLRSLPSGRVISGTPLGRGGA
jgi:integrase